MDMEIARGTDDVFHGHLVSRRWELLQDAREIHTHRIESEIKEMIKWCEGLREVLVRTLCNWHIEDSSYRKETNP